jgi:pyruvate formate lyase activating enzyme
VTGPLPLAERLATLTAPGALARPAADGRLECLACAHRCRLGPGATGVCGVRFHRAGELRVPFGYVAARRVGPVEANTVFHVRPGTRALTFGMVGCDLRCPYCHNWRTSQALRDGGEAGELEEIAAGALADAAAAAGCRVLASAFNEPLISAEWARAVFAAARARGLVTALVSDGNATGEALAYLRPVADVYRVDVKGFAAAQYRTLGGRPGVALDAIREARRLGFWVEAVTLVVPGFNDDPGGLCELAAELRAIDESLPWHLNGFVPRYRMRDRPPTSPAFLLSVAGSALARGLRHVYVGNVAAPWGGLAHTRCPGCHRVLIHRREYTVTWQALDRGRCPGCGTAVSGIWD